MPNCLKHFAPDGVCYEGPAYWGYTTSYLTLYLKAVADNDNGKGGIAQLPGLERTALYQNGHLLRPVVFFISVMRGLMLKILRHFSYSAVCITNLKWLNGIGKS